MFVFAVVANPVVVDNVPLKLLIFPFAIPIDVLKVPTVVLIVPTVVLKLVNRQHKVD